MKYQVLIAGGGPAGSWLARDLAGRGMRVILLERSPRAGEPNFSSAGSPLATVSDFNLPRGAVAAEWQEARTTGGGVTGDWRFPETAGVVFDFRELKKALLAEARAAGAEVALGEEVVEIRNGKIICASGRDYAADIIVDASGPAAVIASRLGLRPEHDSPAVGLESIVEVTDAPGGQERRLEFFWGPEFAPHGYAWIFPMGAGRFKAGICIYHLARYGYDLETKLTEFIRRFGWLAAGKIIETHGGSAYMRGGIRNHVAGNVIAIGDAADQINPVGGEGIRHALQSARLASGFIEQALQAGDVRILSGYNAAWRAYTGRRWRRAARLANFFYPRAGTLAMRLLMPVIARLTPEEAFALIFESKFGVLLRALFRSGRVTAPAR